MFWGVPTILGSAHDESAHDKLQLVSFGASMKFDFLNVVFFSFFQVSLRAAEFGSKCCLALKHEAPAGICYVARAHRVRSARG